MNMSNREKRLPREIMAAAISLKGLWPAPSVDKRMKDILSRLDSVLVFEPDIICLPETVNISWVEEQKTLAQIAEDEKEGGPITKMLAEVAAKNGCYITCPIITRMSDRYYNSSILLNRQGKKEGIFHKIHPTSTEILPDTYFKGGGITPGPVRGNTFKTDFGTVGLQICADADWADGWAAAKDGGAELVCFSSQGPYSNTLRNRAWVNRYFIVSATGEDAQVIDMTGDAIATDNELSRWVCAPVNLEKEVVFASPNISALDKMQKKFKNAVRIKYYYEENWATVESLNADISIKATLDEFDILTIDEELRQTATMQERLRKG